MTLGDGSSVAQNNLPVRRHEYTTCNMDNETLLARYLHSRWYCIEAYRCFGSSE